MGEYVENAVTSVAINNPILFSSSIPCRNGNIYHTDESGIFILRGMTNNCFARYQVTFNGNISVPEGGEVTPIAIAITENGEPRLTSRAIFTPQAVNEYGNVTSTAFITVPDDGSYEGYGDYSRRGSYARGRGRNARRDSRGRYSRRYSRAEAKEDMAEKLEDMMGETNDPTVRKALESAIKRMED